MRDSLDCGANGTRMRRSNVSASPAPNSHSPFRDSHSRRRRVGRGYSGRGTLMVLNAPLPGPLPCGERGRRLATYDAGAAMHPPLETASGLAAVLRGVVADMQHASGADIVSIFLYEESSRKYYAPFATGQPQESLLDSLADMTQQLDRYLGDQKQGKVPDELGIHHYGSTVWLTVTRQKLVARDAPSEIDSTFIRRYQVQATIG